jgi:1-deoxy-D-xylulose-5-phosphate reductoisomerase
VIIHPQSIIHSLVEFVDGSLLAQLSTPDMCLPIQYALTYPERVPSDRVQTHLARLGNLTFEEPDLERFPALNLAREAGEKGGTLPAVLNAANEIAVEAFCSGLLRFDQISEAVAAVMRQHQRLDHPTLDQILEADAGARREARSMIERWPGEDAR